MRGKIVLVLTIALLSSINNIDYSHALDYGVVADDVVDESDHAELRRLCEPVMDVSVDGVINEFDIDRLEEMISICNEPKKPSCSDLRRDLAKQRANYRRNGCHSNPLINGCPSIAKKISELKKATENCGKKSFPVINPGKNNPDTVPVRHYQDYLKYNNPHGF